MNKKLVNNDKAKNKELTLQTPQATVHSSLVADAWFAWHSIHRSIIWFRQIAQLSTTISKTGTKKMIKLVFALRIFQEIDKSVWFDWGYVSVAKFIEITMTHRNWNKATVYR